MNENKSSYFDGTLLGGIGISLLCTLLVIITLGIGTPWAYVMFYEWQSEHTVINGKRLKFTGTGVDLLLKSLIWTLLTIITLGIYGIYVPIAFYKWRIEHTEEDDMKNNIEADEDLINCPYCSGKIRMDAAICIHCGENLSGNEKIAALIKEKIENKKLEQQRKAEAQKAEEERLAREEEQRRQKKEKRRQEAEIAAQKRREWLQKNKKKIIAGVTAGVVAVVMIFGIKSCINAVEQKRIEAERLADQERIEAAKTASDKGFVTVKDIFMLKTEVTQGLYESVMGENPSKFRGEDNPVEYVSWFDAIYFCNKLSEKKGLTPVYAVDGETDVTEWNYTPHKENRLYGKVTQNKSASGYRLPTKEEWEYAARGGENYKYAGSNDIDDVAWYDGNSGDKTHPVAQKKANGYGLYDMSGNVWEWVWDVDPDDDGDRFIRGGSWNGYADGCEVDYGNFSYADGQGIYLGFRVVRSSK